MQWLLRAFAVAVVGSAALGQATVAPVKEAAPAVPAGVVDHAEAVKRLIEQEVEKQKLVGVSVAVGREGKIVFQHHVGFEDREAKVPASAETMYRWASISKPVTATAAMLLVEAGKFELDADVRSLVPEFPAQPNGWVVTNRQLLGHLGGIVHYTNGKVVALPVPATPEHPYEDVVKALDTFKESPLVCEPGTKYSYTTHGYILVSAAVQRAWGARFWSFVKEWIATPAEMSSFRPDYQWEKIEHRAVGYRKGVGGKGEMVRSTDTDVSWKLGGGGFISTVGDLSRFSMRLMDGQLVQPATFKLMMTPQTLKNGEKTGYGLGLSVGKLGGKVTASHSGAQEKTATMMLMVPEERLTVSIMTNTEGASMGKLAEAIALEWMGEKTPAAEKK